MILNGTTWELNVTKLSRQKRESQTSLPLIKPNSKIELLYTQNESLNLNNWRNKENVDRIISRANSSESNKILNYTRSEMEVLKNMTEFNKNRNFTFSIDTQRNSIRKQKRATMGKWTSRKNDKNWRKRRKKTFDSSNISIFQESTRVGIEQVKTTRKLSITSQHSHSFSDFLKKRNKRKSWSNLWKSQLVPGILNAPLLNQCRPGAKKDYNGHCRSKILPLIEGSQNQDTGNGLFNPSLPYIACKEVMLLNQLELHNYLRCTVGWWSVSKIRELVVLGSVVRIPKESTKSRVSNFN